MKSRNTLVAPRPPNVRVSLAVTGHRAAHPLYAEAAVRIEAALSEIFDLIDETARTTPILFGPESLASTRLHTLLADGTDQLAAKLALARNFELVVPLPYGRALNDAINAHATDPGDARALLAGRDAGDSETQSRVAAIRKLAASARVFELADQDANVASLLIDKLEAPTDIARAQRFAAESSRRVALAGRILIEQADVVIAVWDGATTSLLGGTGHTVEIALEQGASVVWINPVNPEEWQVLRTPESLASLSRSSSNADSRREVAELVRETLRPSDLDARKPRLSHVGVASLDAASWHSSSRWVWHAYRRVETLFGGKQRRSRLRSLTQVYESPDAIGTGSGKDLLNEIRALPGGDPSLPEQIESRVLRRFAWADGISSFLSDTYRGGMIVNFLLSALAITGGVAYLPLVPSQQKWGFALFELLLLLAILMITFLGRRRRWHGRWFETRRVAEYLRHSPLLLALGIARAPGRWARGAETSWPEWYVRQTLREIGLPQTVITPSYLRCALTGLLDDHVVRQRDYHFDKTARLTKVHHNLDRLSERFFQLAVASVTFYLMLKLATAFNFLDYNLVDTLSKLFTVLGVVFPTCGAAVSGVRYFGDFERFAAISKVTAEKLDAVHGRIELLSAAADNEITYGRVSELGHLTDDIVVSEIENWQAVFGGKNISVPV